MSIEQMSMFDSMKSDESLKDINRDFKNVNQY